MADERCWLCTFWNGERCTQTFRLVIMLTPIGGQVDFSTIPGMVPTELKEKVSRYMCKFLSKVLPALEVLPIWDEIREFQLAQPDRAECPGRQVAQSKKDYLKLVKF